MKKTLTPNTPEKAVYYSDLSGTKVGDSNYGPQAELTINFNYGSKYDGDNKVLHLSDQEAKKILKFIGSLKKPHQKVAQDSKN